LRDRYFVINIWFGYLFAIVGGEGGDVQSYDGKNSNFSAVGIETFPSLGASNQGSIWSKLGKVTLKSNFVTE